MKFLILMQVDPDVLSGLTEDQQQAIGDGHARFMAETRESGEFVFTQALGDPTQTTTVRGRPGRPEVTEGPFAETKEFLGGYYLIDVESRERAVELAQRIPDAQIDGLALEVRPVMFSEGEPI
ncbi:MAG: hypothetical protein J2P23_01685 [Microlunatus sp.]|nr:hypothetical protein [Microlunatus sp.]